MSIRLPKAQEERAGSAIDELLQRFRTVHAGDGHDVTPEPVREVLT